jgi:L-malate glycosyltransferase
VDGHFRLPLRRTGAALVIPNGVDLREYSDSDASPRARLTLAMVGRLVPLKNHDTLVEAFRILVEDRERRDLALTIAGDGPLRVTLEAQVASMRFRDLVTFTGTLAKAEVIDLLRNTDIYVHCTYGEGMSNSILQAMASRLPIVASDVRGVSNLLRHGVDGLLVPVNDSVALADSLETLIASPEQRSRLGANARDRIERELSQERVVEAYGDLFRSLVEARGITAPAEQARR